MFNGTVCLFVCLKFGSHRISAYPGFGLDSFHCIVYFYISDATLGNLYVKVFNLTWTQELTDNSTYEFLRHANPFCTDVSFLVKRKKKDRY